MNAPDSFLKDAEKIGIVLTPEQLEACDVYVENLRKWQKKINLIGPSTVDSIYTRHILDAVQLIKDVPRGTVLDVGSGAGVPGLVWSIFLDNSIYLCERIGKKASFLKDTTRKLNNSERCKVISDDVANVSGVFDVITARAVTSIRDFLRLTEHCRNKKTLIILPKGKEYLKELEDAMEIWSFTYDVKDSITNINGKTLFIRDVKKK